MTSTTLMMAARAPVPGETKTRLGAAIGHDRAADLYRCFLIDLEQTLGDVERAGVPVAWTFSPPESDFRSELRALGISTGINSCIPQRGADWSERQDNLLRPATADAPLLLMASDSPQLRASELLAAAHAIDAHDAVIGRTLDGGYYLIGFRGYDNVLGRVQMSTASVADEIVNDLTGRGLSVAELEPTFDVDTLDDLKLLAELLHREPKRCPETYRKLTEFGFIPS